MANLDEMITTVIRQGYSQANAVARVCQDIVLKAISETVEVFLGSIQYSR